MQRSREDFIVHFKQTYTDAYPPAWILAEILPFGVMTNIYSNIKIAKIKKKKMKMKKTKINIYSNIKKPQLKKRISQKFGLQVDPFNSWLTIVTLTRNSCCHHARVWNRQNTIRPMIPIIMNGRWITTPTDTLRVYFDLCIIKYFLNIISPQNDMRDKITKLLSDFPNIDPNAMGFTSGWQNEPLWQ